MENIIQDGILSRLQRKIAESPDRFELEKSYIVFILNMNMDEKYLAGCVIMKDGKILLMKRKKRQWYELPGGKLEDGETPEQAAVREIKEELCCDVKLVRKIGNKKFKQDSRELDYTWFLASIVSGEPVVGDPDDYDDLKYVPMEKLKEHKLSPNMQNLLREIEEKSILL